MLIGETLKTKFAAPERLVKDAALAQHKEILNDKNLSLLYDFTTDFILVLNEYRQIIFTNKTLLNFLKKSDVKEIIGQRPGEILNCSGSDGETGGCGTSMRCSACGAVKAISAANYLDTKVEECCIQTLDGNTYNFRVWAAWPWKDKDYTL